MLIAAFHHGREKAVACYKRKYPIYSLRSSCNQYAFNNGSGGGKQQQQIEPPFVVCEAKAVEKERNRNHSKCRKECFWQTEYVLYTRYLSCAFAVIHHVPDHFQVSYGHCLAYVTYIHKYSAEECDDKRP